MICPYCKERTNTNKCPNCKAEIPQVKPVVKPEKEDKTNGGKS